MNIKGLRAFTQIMATGTLAAAAKTMHTSESALSRQLSLLEAELGLVLFSRDKRRLVPTAEGEAFYREAERILDSIEQIPTIVDEIKRRPRRRMRLIVMPRIAAAIAAPAVGQFLEENPEMEINIEVQPRRLLERWVASHQFDIGLGALPARHSAIETERVCSIPAVVVMHPNHPLAGRSSLQVKELAGEHLITMPHSTLLGSQIARLFDDADIEMKSSIQVSQTVFCCSLVANNFGIAITDAMIPEMFGDSLRIVPIAPEITLDFGLLYPRGVEHPPEVLEFAEVVKQQAQTYMDTLRFT